MPNNKVVIIKLFQNCELVFKSENGTGKQ